MAMSKHHVRGALKMVELNGGPQTLGLDGFLKMVVQKYAGQVGLTLDWLAQPLPPEVFNYNLRN